MKKGSQKPENVVSTLIQKKTKQGVSEKTGMLKEKVSEALFLGRLTEQDIQAINSPTRIIGFKK